MITDDAFPLIGPWDQPGTYRGALLIPIDDKDRVLVQLRDYNPAAIYPGKWGLFGGGVEDDETLVGAACREFLEETGITVLPHALRPFARVLGDSGAQLFAFSCRLDGTPADIRLGEGAGFAFLGPDDLTRLDLVPASRALLEYWISSQSNRG